MFKKIASTLALLAVAFTANATIISYELDYEFSGATAPADPSPWLAVTFDDNDTAGSVNITFDSMLNEAGSFFHGIYFNLDPLLQPTDLGVNFGIGTPVSSMGFGLDAFQADGSGLYDFVINFGNGDFGGYDSFSIELTGADITADSFAYYNTPNGGNGVYHVAAHVGGLGLDNQDSGWIGDAGTPPSVPEPSSLLLMGLGILGLTFSMKKRRA